MKQLLLFLAVIFVAVLVITSCGTKELIAKRDIGLIDNWNTSSLDKQINCYIAKGEMVEKLETSSVSGGSTLSFQVIRVRLVSRPDCEGWATADSFKRP